MYKEFQCPFKDACINDLCIIKLYEATYIDSFNMCSILQNVNFIIPNFLVSYYASGSTFKLRCSNYKGIKDE